MSGSTRKRTSRWSTTPPPNRWTCSPKASSTRIWRSRPKCRNCARKVGHVILRTAVDRPWSQYFCCMLAANREYVARYPVATKRVIRAVLKAADLCAGEPEMAARLIVEGGFTERYDYALQTLTENPYGAWREYDAEDTIRFYALRLHELGMIKSSPQKIIANGTDWRFLNELKRELKT